MLFESVKLLLTKSFMCRHKILRARSWTEAMELYGQLLHPPVDPCHLECYSVKRMEMRHG